MKILFNCNLPVLLAHGGMQIQIELTRAALVKLGLDVEYLRWWDGSQKCDVLHHFGRMPEHLVHLAHDKGIKVVMTDLVTGQGSRPLSRLRAQALALRVMKSVLPRSLVGHFGWESYRLVDVCVANTPWEARVMQMLFGVSQERMPVVPNGVEEVFRRSQPVARGPWLVCVATIAHRKRMVELAEAAVQAETPLWVIGKPYSDADPYARRFAQLAGQHDRLIRFDGPVEDRVKLAEIYRQARGFVLLSTKETRSLSAEEAAACACPLLLSDLPWARNLFGSAAAYCPITPATGETAAVLRRFYDAAPTLKPPPVPCSWEDVARQLKGIYETLVTSGR